MIRKTDTQRDSQPASHELFADKAEKARLEAWNGLLQFDEVLRLADEAIAGKSFRLRPSTIQSLQRLAIKDIYTCAGNFRTHPVLIGNTAHRPPSPEQITGLVEEMCDYINESADKTPIHFSAYATWRVNWIHPFAAATAEPLGQCPTWFFWLSWDIIFLEPRLFQSLSSATESHITRRSMPPTRHGGRGEWTCRKWKLSCRPI